MISFLQLQLDKDLLNIIVPCIKVASYKVPNNYLNIYFGKNKSTDLPTLLIVSSLYIYD